MVLECKASVNIPHGRHTQDVGGIARGQMVLQLPEDMQIAEKMIPIPEGQESYRRGSWMIMWNSATVMMIVEGTFATLYMTLVSTLMAYVIGLPQAWPWW